VKLGAMGIEIGDREFGAAGRLILRGVGVLPGALTERVLFGDLPYAVRNVLQKALQRLVGGPRAIRVRFTAGPLAGWDFDCLTSERYFVLGANYEQSVIDTLARLVRPGDVVYDVGAHAGYSALAFARLSGDGHVYAFEPSPATFERLCRNVELNGARIVTPINAGAWDAEGRLRLAEKGTESRVLAEGVSADVPVSDVRLLRLDDFAYRDGHPPADVLKIDVEGLGVRVLTGAREMLASARPRVLLEVHDPGEQREALDILRRHGYATSALESARRYPFHVLARPATAVLRAPQDARLSA
jgi:FkbM family methyltransferase